MRRSLEVVGVVRTAVKRVIRLDAAAPGRSVRPAEQGRAGGAHPGDGGGVAVRDVAGALWNADCGHETGGLEVVLGRERDVQRHDRVQGRVTASIRLS